MTRWEKERLTEQLKFFGAKKTRFISCYAKKPRILCKVKVTNIPMQYGAERQLANLYQDQLNRCIERSFLGYNQMAQAQMAMSHQLGCGQLGNMQNHGLAGGLGGLFGMGGYGATRQ